MFFVFNLRHGPRLDKFPPTAASDWCRCNCALKLLTTETTTQQQHSGNIGVPFLASTSTSTHRSSRSHVAEMTLLHLASLKGRKGTAGHGERERERETAATERLHGCSTDAINFVSDRPQHTGHADDCRIRNLKLAEQDVSYGHGHVNAAVAMTVVVTHGLRTAGANLEPINEAEWKYCEFI